MHGVGSFVCLIEQPVDAEPPGLDTELSEHQPQPVLGHRRAVGVDRGDRYRIVSRLKLAADAAPAGPPAGHHPGMPPGDLPHGTPVTASTLGDVQG